MHIDQVHPHSLQMINYLQTLSSQHTALINVSNERGSPCAVNSSRVDWNFLCIRLSVHPGSGLSSSDGLHLSPSSAYTWSGSHCFGASMCLSKRLTGRQPIGKAGGSSVLVQMCSHNHTDRIEYGHCMQDAKITMN